MVKVLPIILGIYVAYMFYSFGGKEESFLLTRMKKIGKKQVAWHQKIISSFLELLKPISVENIKNVKVKNDIRKLLARVGLPSGEDDILEFENKRLILVVVALVISAFILIIKFTTTTALIAITVILFTYKLPVYRLNKVIEKKQKDFEKGFPDAIDLLAVCIEAGLGLDAAVERVGREFEMFSPAVSSEFLRISKDVASGVPRREAFKNLSERIQSKELQSFIALLIQSEKLGTSIAQSLGVYCDSMRTRRKQRVEELVQKSSAKMTIPMVLFLLPALFITILYPAVIKLIEGMGSAGGIGGGVGGF